MGSIPSELSSDDRQTHINPQTISGFLLEVSMIGNVSERLMKYDDFIKRLEEEMRKIDAFKRELPLCMLLINDAIEALKEESIQCGKSNVKPLFEEFISLKKTCVEEEKNEISRKDIDSRDKKNWLSSAQLWNNDDSSNTNFSYNGKQNLPIEIKKRTEQENRPVTDDPFQSCKRAFMPFKGYSAFPATATRREEKEELPVVGLSLVIPGTKNLREQLSSGCLSSKSSGSRGASSSAPNIQSNLRAAPQTQQTTRKQRRCWSPELHRRFINALQQLGGSQAATPKQIREFMQVDGLTNDEVKSHLQKYRLHTRRVPATTTTPGNQSVVALEGFWMTQDQYSESSKQSNSHSGSPLGPLQLTGITGGGDSMEDDEDEKSESHSWKSHIHISGKDDV